MKLHSLPNEDSLTDANREEIISAIFSNMVYQQTNMALMFLGKVAHPETNEILFDIESAKLFIDQLEMLEAKTKGNLNAAESNMLKQSLSALHHEFVNVVNAQLSEDPVVNPPVAQSIRTA